MRGTARAKAVVLALLALLALAVPCSADVFFVWPAIGTGTDANTVILNRGQTLNVTIDFTAPYPDSRTFSAWVFKAGAGAGEHTAQIASNQLMTANALGNVVPWLVLPAVYGSGSYYIRATAGGDTRVSANVVVRVPALRVDLAPPAEAYAGLLYGVRVSVAVPTPPGSSGVAAAVAGLGVGAVTLALCEPASDACAAPALYAGTPAWAPDPADPARYTASMTVRMGEAQARAAAWQLRLAADGEPLAVAFSPSFLLSSDPLRASLAATGPLRALASYTLTWSLARPAIVSAAIVTATSRTALLQGRAQAGSAAVRVPWEARGSAATLVVTAERAGALSADVVELAVEVAPAALSLDAPAAGAYAPPGRPLAVRWACTADVPRWTVGLSFDGSNATVRELASGVAATSFTWDVPPASLIGLLPSAAIVVWATDAPYGAELRAAVQVRVDEEPVLPGIAASRVGPFTVALSVCGSLSLVAALAALAWLYLRAQRRKQAAAARSGGQGEYTEWSLWERLVQRGGSVGAQVRSGLRAFSESIRSRLPSRAGASRSGAYGGGQPANGPMALPAGVPLASAWGPDMKVRPPRRGPPPPAAFVLGPPPPPPPPKAAGPPRPVLRPPPRKPPAPAVGKAPVARRAATMPEGAAGQLPGQLAPVEESPRSFVTVHRPPPPPAAARPGRPVPVRATRTEVWTLQDVDE